MAFAVDKTIQAVKTLWEYYSFRREFYGMDNPNGKALVCGSSKQLETVCNSFVRSGWLVHRKGSRYAILVR